MRWTNVFRNRLAMAATMVALALLALSYWWLGNLAHEIFGVAFFAILIRHIIMQRRWLSNLSKGPYGMRRLVVVALHVVLMVNMALLLVTSLLISKSVFRFLSIPDSVPTRDVHWFSAYWVMMNVGIHLGLHWPRVMAMTRSKLGLSHASFARTLMLRLGTAVGIIYGVCSLSVLSIWTKLTFNFSLVFWNFNISVLPFFIHWVAVIMLPASLAHYAAKLRNKGPGLRSAPVDGGK